MSPVVATATKRIGESFALRQDGPDGSTTGLVSGVEDGVSCERIQLMAGGA